mgnify:FL=1
MPKTAKEVADDALEAAWTKELAAYRKLTELYQAVTKAEGALKNCQRDRDVAQKTVESVVAGATT